VFKKYYPDPLQRKPLRVHAAEMRQAPEDLEYGKIISWFESGNKIDISDDMPLNEYFGELDRVKGLRDVTKKHLDLSENNRHELASAMEFTLDGLHQFSKIAKDEVDHNVEYKDLVGSIFTGRAKSEEDD
jgi:magnesium chelatase subunit I